LVNALRASIREECELLGRCRCEVDDGGVAPPCGVRPVQRRTKKGAQYVPEHRMSCVRHDDDVKSDDHVILITSSCARYVLVPLQLTVVGVPLQLTPYQ
jgi:hypothetical protein